MGRIFGFGLLFMLILGIYLVSNSTADKKNFKINTETIVAKPFGIFNREANENTQVVYQVSAGSVIVGCIFCETVIIPVYIVGWDLWEPARLKTEKELKDSTNNKTEIKIKF